MLSYSKINMLLGCFNQYVFSDAKMNLDYIKKFYHQGTYGATNTLQDKLLYILEQYKFQDITEPLFISAFQSDGKSDAEIGELINKIKEYKSFTSSQAQIFKDDLKELCYQAAVYEAKKKYPEDSVKFTEELKRFAYKTNSSNNLTVKKFSELDITDLAKMYSGEGYKSAFKVINDSFTIGGYIPGQIVAICAAPGCFHGDTKIRARRKDTLAEELVTIRDLSQYYDDYQVLTVNTELWSVENPESSYEWSNIVHCWITKKTRNLVNISVDGASDVVCTPDHKFMTDKGWVRADELNYMADIWGHLNGESVDLLFNDVSHIDVDSEVEVYDLMTESDNHNFILENGMIAHNCGKSLFVQNEVVNFIKQGKRVHYLTLGDLNELDMASRLTCMMSRKPKRVIESDILNYYEMYKDKFGDLLGLTVVPSGVVSADEYVEWALEHKDEYDILIIDYDSNFSMQGSGSMYSDFGEVYDKLTQLSRVGKLVFVCTQPKISAYKNEEGTLEDIGESSRKQHIIDMMIFVGRRFESKMRMGKITICKNRRGDLGQAMWIGTNEGLFYECSNVLYARFRNQSEYIKLLSYEDLQAMDVLSDVLDDNDTIL